jgi:hypothetical protein
MKRFLLFAALLLLAPHPASGAARSLGYAIWNVTGGSVRVLYMLPEPEAKNIVVAGSPVPTTKQVADYVLAHVAVTHRGKPCEAVDQGEEVGLVNALALTPGLLRFEIVFECPDGAGLTLSDTAFYDRVANHIDFARVQIDNGGFTEHVFSPYAPKLELPAAGEALQSDSVLRYAALGLYHVLGRADIWCFVLALLLIARGRRDYILALGALAAGYGLAVLLASLHLAAPRFGTGQAFAGLLVFLAAASGAVMSLRDPGRGAWALGASLLALAVPALFLRGALAALAVTGAALLAAGALFMPGRDSQRRVFLLMASFLFALLDGFDLAGDVAVLALPSAPLASMLVSFNAATLLAEVVLALCLVAACLRVPVIRRMTAPGALLPDLAASGFIGCGLFWFVTGLYG